MKIRLGKSQDKKEYIITTKEEFPFLDSKKISKYFDLKIKNKEIFVAEKNKEYAGHICFEKYILNPPFEKSIFISGLIVKKRFQKKGIGSVLIARIVKYCKKHKIPMIHLSTGDHKNNKAIKFYKKHGFKKVGYLKDINPKSEYPYSQIFYAVMLDDWKEKKESIIV